jgi:hypothetical protein
MPKTKVRKSRVRKSRTRKSLRTKRGGTRDKTQTESKKAEKSTAIPKYGSKIIDLHPKDGPSYFKNTDTNISSALNNVASFSMPDSSRVPTVATASSNLSKSESNNASARPNTPDEADLPAYLFYNGPSYVRKTKK